MNRRNILIGALVLVGACVFVLFLAVIFGSETETAPEPTAAIIGG